VALVRSSVVWLVVGRVRRTCVVWRMVGRMRRSRVVRRVVGRVGYRVGRGVVVVVNNTIRGRIVYLLVVNMS
jgi:hypothetical protein